MMLRLSQKKWFNYYVSLLLQTLGACSWHKKSSYTETATLERPLLLFLLHEHDPTAAESITKGMVNKHKS